MLKMEWKVTAPFFFIDVEALAEVGKQIYEAFIAYAKAIVQVIEESCVDTIEKAERLPEEAEDIKRTAEPDFERLEMMQKAKATMATAVNLKLISKIPAFIKGVIADIKNDLMELKEAVMDLKNALMKIKADAKTCADNNVSSAVECYTQIYGPIKYTVDERKEWEEKMNQRAWRLGIKFVPEDYPTTHMISNTPNK